MPTLFALIILGAIIYGIYKFMDLVGIASFVSTFVRHAGFTGASNVVVGLLLATVIFLLFVMSIREPRDKEN